MSPSEKSAYDAEMAAAKGKLAEIRVAKDDLAVIEKAAEISPCSYAQRHFWRSKPTEQLRSME